MEHTRYGREASDTETIAFLDREGIARESFDDDKLLATREVASIGV